MFLGRIQELLVIVVFITVLFGNKKLPKLAHYVTFSVREVRKAFSGEKPA
jgi:Sec-independent protein translocase protein TatA